MDVDVLHRAIETKIKHVFKTSLRCIEMKFGDEFSGYDKIRAEILRVGNNAIRELKELAEEEAYGVYSDEENQR